MSTHPTLSAPGLTAARDSRRHLLPALRAALPLCALLLLGACGGQDGEHAAEEGGVEHASHGAAVRLAAEDARAIGLATVTLREQSWEGTVALPAELVADQDLEAEVGSFIDGRVSKVFARLGQRVRRGQVLMTIEGLGVGEIKAGFIRAQAQLRFAEEALRRQKALLAQNAGSQRAVAEAQAAYDQALASFTAEDRRIHSIGLDDRDVAAFVGRADSDPQAHTAGALPILAPIDGVVVERNVVIGQPVDPTIRAFRILNTATLWVDAHVREADAAALRGVRQATLRVQALPGAAFPAEITYVGERVEAATRTMLVRATVRNTQGVLKPDMFGTLLVPVARQVRGLLLPAEAVQQAQAGQFVFVARDDSSYAVRSIEAEALADTLVVVRRGLRAGERVVTSGAFQLKAELLKSTFGEEGGH